MAGSCPLVAHSSGELAINCIRWNSLISQSQMSGFLPHFFLLPSSSFCVIGSLPSVARNFPLQTRIRTRTSIPMSLNTHLPLCCVIRSCRYYDCRQFTFCYFNLAPNPRLDSIFVHPTVCAGTAIVASSRSAISTSYLTQDSTRF